MPLRPELTYWSDAAAAVLRALDTTPEGLNAAAARRRLLVYGPNRLRARARLSRLDTVTAQFRNPLLLLLVVAAALSAFSGEWVDAAIVFAIVTASVLVTASREYTAQAVVAALQSRIRAASDVVRDGRRMQVPSEDIVPGDIVILAAGDLIPGDGLVLESTDCYVNQAVLTGESFPVAKSTEAVPPDTPLAGRTNCVFLGTTVSSGTARYVVVATGVDTELGHIAHRLRTRHPETNFEQGLRRFGYLLTVAMLLLTLGVFAAHVIGGRPPVETLLFAVALAVGLSPELLPAILSVNLTRGAQIMARHGVMVRHLNAIENLGSMDVLCTDKTGTLTEGVVRLEGAYDAAGRPSQEVLRLAALNAALETGLHNPLDDAIQKAADAGTPLPGKLGEIPFDPVRRRVSIIVTASNGALLIAKGSVAAILDVSERLPDGSPITEATRAQVEALAEQWGTKGIRALAVATRAMSSDGPYSALDEQGLTLVGLLTFLDSPKPGVSAAITQLATLGVAVKLITGDNAHVARYVAGLVGLDASRVITGSELHTMSQEALWQVAPDTAVFAEVDPSQKERIIQALRSRGAVVGFLGDGVNDAPAMHAADASLAVDQAVDVARAVADFVLLERDLDVIRRGIIEGRRTFANTMKYILTTTSANLGNMVSMAAASLFLPFLPLLAGQILLNNFLSDIPALGIADDSVDPELVTRPERWDLRAIGRFMVAFGLLSSVFDVLTFAVLLVGFSASPALFRSAWFVESLLTELVIALVVRTRRPFYRSRPGALLLWSTLALLPLSFMVPSLPGAHAFGFVPLTPAVAVSLGVIAGAYVVATELGKRAFFGPPSAAHV